MTRVAFLACHLSGSGHLARTLALARGVAAAGAQALVISGGRALPHLGAGGVALAQLPPVAVAGFDYARLLTAAGAPADAAYMAARADLLAALLRDFAPDVLVTELFPFGRRILAPEFELALEIARARGARAFCSVRDIPEPPRKDARAAEAEARLRHWYDAVLVHGDAALAPFALGWPQAARIADMLRHTGYVAEALPPPAGDPAEVLVAEGGGALGRGLLDCAVAAARLGARPWRLRVGGADAAATVARLAALAGGAPVTVEPAAPDYRARLRTCAASVSLLGYNTAVDLLQSGAPAVVAPMVAADEREQALRAAAFARLPQFETLDAASLTPQALAAAVARAIRRGRVTGPTVDLNGVAASARILLGG